MAASSELPDTVCLWWIHSFYWNILIVFCGISCSFLTLACVTSVPYVSYRILLRAYRDMYRCLCIGDIPVCRCIVSALPNWHFTDNIFKCVFSNENYCILIWIQLKFVLQGSNWQKVSIGRVNGLAPTWQQAITWINDEPVHWCTYESPDLNELTLQVPVQYKYGTQNLLSLYQ